MMNPTTNLDVVVSSGNNAGLKEPIMLAWGIPGSKVVQYTIHRRIGVDPHIPDDGWVLSQSTDVVGFLENQTDERIPHVAKQIAVMRTEYLISVGALVRDGDKIVYAKTDIERSKARNEASRAFEAFKKGNPEGDRKLEEFYPAGVAEKESHIKELLTQPDLNKKIERLKNSLSDFVTLGGPSGDRRQREIPRLRGTVSKGKIISKVIQMLWTKDDDESHDPSGTEEPYSEEEGSEEDSLAWYISKLNDLQGLLRLKRGLLKDADAEQSDDLQADIRKILEDIKACRAKIAEIEDTEVP